MFQRICRCDIWKNGNWKHAGKALFETIEGSLKEFALNELREFINDGKEVDIQFHSRAAYAKVWDSARNVKWDITYEEA